LLEVRNLVDAVFRMEACRNLPDVIAVVHALKEVLRAPGMQKVRRAFNQWIKTMLLRRATASMIEEINTIRDVFEEFEMLTQHKETWFDDDIEKSFLQGRERGREEGLEKGLEKGRGEGREEERLAIARKLLGIGMPVESVAQITELSRETIQTLLH